MPKMKTHKGTAKRVKSTSSGKLLRRHAFGVHNLGKKSGARKRKYGQDHGVPAVSVKSIKRNLGE